jgi:S1-C subfamily serine protease
MKQILFFFGTMLICSNLLGQCLKSESAFKIFFEQNIQNLDPIEGIWSVNVKSKKYYGGSFKAEASNQNVKTWAIKKSGEKFIVCELNDAPNEFLITFSKTAISGIYIYDKKNQWNNLIYTTNATLTGNSFLEYSYQLNEEDIKKHYLAEQKRAGLTLSANELKLFVSQTQLINEFKWIKIFPTEKEVKKSANTTGTGFAISANGLIATCNHVIEGANSIKVKGVKGNFNFSYNAEVVSTDVNNDVAILKISDASFSGFGIIPYTIKSASSDVGSNIFILGYPLIATMGDEIKLTNGIISAKSGYKGDITSYQLSAAAQPGNSGGPLFDALGNLIGVVNAKHVQADNATYAVKSVYLLNLIESLSTTPALQTVNILSKKSLPEQIKSIKYFVYIIEVN